MSLWSRLKQMVLGNGGRTAESAMEPMSENQPAESSEDAANDITLDQAHAAVKAAIRKSEEMGVKMDIAVVDTGVRLKAFARMDGAWRGSIDIAQRKARTARYFDMPTGAIGELSQPGEALFRIEHSNRGLISFPGGLPIRNSTGEIVGAIGVSGSSVEDDHAVAEAGVAAAS